jgi:hypothetical protein
MRASELLRAEVVDGEGRSLGRVRDVRIEPADGATTRGGFGVVGVVVSGGRWSHACGFADGRAQGPWLLRVLLGRSAARARFVPARHVSDWGPGQVRLSVAAAQLRPLREELAS